MMWAMSCTTGLMETIFSLEQNILVFLLWDAPKKKYLIHQPSHVKEHVSHPQPHILT